MNPERYLIDSNIVIYRANDVRLLTPEVQDILDHSSLVYVPSKCVEELIYLQHAGRIELKQCKSPEDVVGYIIDVLKYGIWYVGEGHLRALARLPLFRDHKDPTDRIIIAQAIAEEITLVSSDTKFHDYKRSGLKFIFNDKNKR
ncbi:hypothetical protein R80B4_01402 [Fibrobacteres bacterium R8-0-B4]